MRPIRDFLGVSFEVLLKVYCSSYWTKSVFLYTVSCPWIPISNKCKLMLNIIFVKTSSLHSARYYDDNKSENESSFRTFLVKSLRCVLTWPMMRFQKKKLQNHHFPYMYANSEQQFCLLGLTRTVADLKIICPKIRTDFAVSIRE